MVRWYTSPFRARLRRVNGHGRNRDEAPPRVRILQTLMTVGALAWLVIGVPGCSRYDIQGDGQGRIVRIDRLTGAVDYLQGSRFVRIENPGDHRREAEELARVHDWGALTYDNKYTLRLKTAFRNDRLYYQIGIVPVPPATVFNFRIALNDADGFQVASLSLNTPDGVPTADSGVAYSGFTQSEAEVYRSVRSWTPRLELYNGRIAPAELP